MTFGLCACGFLPNNIVAITCPQCGVPQCADCESSPVPPLSWAKGRAGGGPPVIIFPTDLKRRYYWFRPHSLGLHPPRCPWEASPPRESVSPVASLLSISPTINSQQPLLSLTGNIRNCRSLPTWSDRAPLSVFGVILGGHPHLRGLSRGRPHLFAAMNSQLFPLSPPGNVWNCRQLPTDLRDTLSAASFELAATVLPQFLPVSTNNIPNALVSGPTGHLPLDLKALSWLSFQVTLHSSRPGSWTAYINHAWTGRHSSNDPLAFHRGTTLKQAWIESPQLGSRLIATIIENGFSIIPWMPWSTENVELFLAVPSQQPHP
jgi:hypothetical protein